MPASPAPEPRTRDAARSRAAILEAAEERFAKQGYEATSLADIGGRAGVSRGTPSYFFGSKEGLYAAVLERLHEARDAALGPAFAEIEAWARQADPPRPLAEVLERGVGAYLDFLHDRPAYVAIIEREALAGGERLAALPHHSTVMEDAFAALRRHARAHGLGTFDPGEAVMCLVALGFMPVAHRHTLVRRQGKDLDDPRFRARRRRHITDLLLHLLAP